ncbi:MAG: hypothetical protein RML10_01565 [Geminocystis sp.]|nr:hypothetical protein [Geminocystis sp.]
MRPSFPAVWAAKLNKLGNNLTMSSLVVGNSLRALVAARSLLEDFVPSWASFNCI